MVVSLEYKVYNNFVWISIHTTVGKHNCFQLIIVYVYLKRSHYNISGQCEVDFLILLDSSGSINDDDPSNWDYVLDLTRSLVDALDQYTTVGDQSQVAIFTYSYEIRRHVTFNQFYNRADIQQFIAEGGVTYQGGFTRMHLAVQEGRDYLASSIRATSISEDIKAQQVLLLFTDGEPCADDPCEDGLEGETVDNVVSVLSGLMDSGIYVYIIGKALRAAVMG